MPAMPALIAFMTTALAVLSTVAQSITHMRNLPWSTLSGRNFSGSGGPPSMIIGAVIGFPVSGPTWCTTDVA